MMSSRYDAVVIGAGVIGTSVALHLRKSGDRVLLVDREAAILQRASYINQARVHNGYQYPRSLLTGLRSRVNFPRFVTEYGDCIVRDFEKYYAIARRFSKVTGDQFVAFCRRIGAPVGPAPASVRKLFDRNLIEEVYAVQEYAFDAAKLARRLRSELAAADVELRLAVSANRIRQRGELLELELDQGGHHESVTGRHVFNCTYSNVNGLLARSGLPLIPLRHEVTELALVKVPDPLSSVGVTVMCGPFFSIMPFPARGLHSFSHVRYTPHRAWEERGEPIAPHPVPPPSNFPRMQLDAQRYLPIMREVRHVESLYETKTILPSSEMDDSRPILFKQDHGLPNLTCILGAKIDNIYDVLAELDIQRQATGAAR